MPIEKSISKQKYKVISPYQCCNTKHWHKTEEEVLLLPCEAEFLVLSQKIKLVAPLNQIKAKGETNA